MMYTLNADLLSSSLNYTVIVSKNVTGVWSRAANKLKQKGDGSLKLLTKELIKDHHTVIRDI